MKQRVHNTTNWEEHEYIDMWTSVHFLGGLVGGGAGHIVGLSVGWMLVCGVVLGTTWEVVEYHLHIEEYFINRISDVVIALIGAYAMFVVFVNTSPRLLFEIFVVVLIAVIWTLFGYEGFRTHVTQNKHDTT